MNDPVSSDANLLKGFAGHDPNQTDGSAKGVFSLREAEIAGLVATHFGVEPVKVTRHAHLIDDLGADSLDIVELVMAIEEHFGIEITDDEAEKVTTVDTLFDVIRGKLPS